MPRRIIATILGFGLIGVGLLIILAESLSSDGFRNHWRSLGLGTLDSGTNYIVFGMIIIGAIIVVITGVRTMKDPI